MKKKQAYKCMKKTGIQMYEKKQAYKCMTKTHIQTRIQMYEKKYTQILERWTANYSIQGA